MESHRHVMQPRSLSRESGPTFWVLCLGYVRDVETDYRPSLVSLLDGWETE